MDAVPTLVSVKAPVFDSVASPDIATTADILELLPTHIFALDSGIDTVPVNVGPLSVGPFENTRLPLPVSSVIALARLADVSDIP